MPLDYSAPIPWNGVDVPPSNTGAWSPCGVNGLSERYEWRSPDGNVYNLHNFGTVFTLNFQGEGMPPIQYVTQRAAFQDGVTLVDEFLQPRVIQLLLRVNARSRSEYWDNRKRLLNLLRPNRQFFGSGGLTGSAISPGSLRYYLPNGDVRQIDCVIQQGPNFEPRAGDKWDEWSFQELLRFVAHDPTFYYPSQKTVVASAGSQLVFPITFPITFQGLDAVLNVSYAGNIRAFPRMTVTGPVSDLLIQNKTTGDLILLNYTLDAGRRLIIDLAFGPQKSKVVQLDDGTNLIQYVDKTSTLSTFHLEPEPMAFDGINVLELSGGGTSGATEIDVAWYDRYIGI